MIIERRALTGKYADLLRHACRVLCNVPAYVIGSVSVTFAVGSNEELGDVVGLIERLAEEYELQSRSEFVGLSLTAYFRRRPEAGEM